MQRVSVLCSDPAHPVNAWLQQWAEANSPRAQIDILRDRGDLSGGDFLLLISCHQIVEKEFRDRYRHSLVVHASDLPQGRGWSPLIWSIAGGADCVTVSLLNAEDAVDSGDIWTQVQLSFDGTELHDEINVKLFRAELQLLDWALTHCDGEEPRKQEGKPSFHPKRTPADSEIDPAKPLQESFDLLRVADPHRYPAFFHYRGQKYHIRIEKSQ